MSTGRIALSTLLGLALLAILSLGSAALNWTSTWQGFDRLTMAVEGVEISDDHTTIHVHVSFTNTSDDDVRIHALDTGLRLSGRSVTAGSERYDDLLLEPREDVALRTTQRVTGLDVAFLNERLSGDGVTWNVQGRVRVSVEGLSEELWLPFRVDVSAD